jgi:hypothetical protein
MPFHLAMLPPAIVKSPPTYKSPPETANAYAVGYHAPPSGGFGGMTGPDDLTVSAARDCAPAVTASPLKMHVLTASIIA